MTQSVINLIEKAYKKGFYTAVSIAIANFPNNTHKRHFATEKELNEIINNYVNYLKKTEKKEHKFVYLVQKSFFLPVKQEVNRVYKAYADENRAYNLVKRLNEIKQRQNPFTNSYFYYTTVKIKE